MKFGKNILDYPFYILMTVFYTLSIVFYFMCILSLRSPDGIELLSRITTENGDLYTYVILSVFVLCPLVFTHAITLSWGISKYLAKKEVI